MNSCILMAQIVSDPELRSTQDQISVSTMMVEFESSREGEAPGKVQVEGWGNLAEEIKNTYSSGDRVIIEGRLSMNLFEMPEGYKEKRAKLVASRIYPLGVSTSSSLNYQQPDNVVNFVPSPPPAPTDVDTYADTPATTPEPAAAPASGGNEDWDEIPFGRPVYSRTNFGSQLCDSWELEANRYWDGVKQFV
ncbi:MAG: single-stranded DNA-binding protein [Waterburya sp.]